MHQESKDLNPSTLPRPASSAGFIDKLNEVLVSKKSFFQDPINQISLLIASLLNIIHWAILASKIKPNQGNILLHYNVITGPDLINKSIYAYSIPLLALILLVLNYFLSSVFYKREKFVGYFINLSNIPIQLIFFVATIVLISINAQ